MLTKQIYLARSKKKEKDISDKQMLLVLYCNGIRRIIKRGFPCYPLQYAKCNYSLNMDSSELKITCSYLPAHICHHVTIISNLANTYSNVFKYTIHFNKQISFQNI